MAGILIRKETGQHIHERSTIIALAAVERDHRGVQVLLGQAAGKLFKNLVGVLALSQQAAGPIQFGLHDGIGA